MARQKKQHLKRRADGRYRCTYHGKQFMGHTEAEAFAARDEYIRTESLREAQAQYFGPYGEEWLDAYKSHLTKGPYNTHVRNINTFIEVCGNKPLKDYKPTDISKYYQHYVGMSASTIHSARDTIKAIFKAALNDGYIAKDPAAAIQPPKGTKGTHRAISPQERMLIHTVQHRLRPAVMTMLYAGLRKGEAMALDVDRDVDFKKGTITVREAVRFDTDGSPIICRPKTEAGFRTIPLLDILANELKGRHGLICTSAGGKMMTQSAWERAWDSYLTALSECLNGGKKRWIYGPWQPVEIRAHDLRHSFCTLLYELGVDLKTSMLWMGHADQTMTMRIYTHLTDQQRSQAENALKNADKIALSMQKEVQVLPEITEHVDK